MNFNKTLFKTYLIYFVVIVAFVLLRIFVSMGALNFIKDIMWQSNIATIFIQIFIMGLLPLIMCKLLFKTNFKQIFKDLGFKKISFKAVLICLLLGIVVYALNIMVANIFSIILSIFGYSAGGEGYAIDSFWKFIVSTIFVAILPAIFEEITHRGLLLRKTASEVGYKKAIIISSVFFGLMHLNVSQFFYATFIGIIIGFTSSVSGSIFPAMILHFMNNFINVYFSYAQACKLPGYGLFDKISNILSETNFLIVMLVMALIFVVLVVSLIYLVIQLFKETRNKEISKSILQVASAVNEVNENELKEEQLETTFHQFILPLLKNDDALDILLPKTTNKEQKFDLKTNVFKICTIFLSVLITFFTFLWGII